MPRGRPIIKRKGRNNTGTVYYHKGRKHWAWQVSVGGKRKTGYAATSEEAEAAKSWGRCTCSRASYSLPEIPGSLNGLHRGWKGRLPGSRWDS